MNHDFPPYDWTAKVMYDIPSGIFVVLTIGGQQEPLTIFAINAHIQTDLFSATASQNRRE